LNIDNEKQDTIGKRQKVVAASLRIAGVASVLTIENSVHPTTTIRHIF